MSDFADSPMRRSADAVIRVGYIPYLNMAPFHRGFGPEPFEADGVRYEFPVCTPRTLGIEAEQGRVDAGALSLVDSLRLSALFEPLGNWELGSKDRRRACWSFRRFP